MHSLPMQYDRSAAKPGEPQCSYMAPEILSSQEESLTKQSDVYSFAMAIYEVLLSSPYIVIAYIAGFTVRFSRGINHMMGLLTQL